MTDLLLMAAFVVGGLPVSVLLLTRVEALLAAPLISSVLATAAAVVHVAVDVPIGLIWLLLVGASAVVVALVPRARARALASLRQAVEWQQYLRLGIAGALVLIVAVLVPAPIAWDARSIWLFHGSWLAGPARDYLDGLVLPALEFSHPDYPVLGPASAAVTWNFTGQPEDLTLGVRVLAMLSVVAVAFAATFALARLAQRAHPVTVTAAFVLFTTAALPLADRSINQGYVDVAQAGYIVALASVLLTQLGARMPWPTAALAAILAVGAVNVKQEGFWFVLVVLAVYLVVSYRTQTLAKYLPLAAVLAAYGGWRLFLSVNGASDSSDAAGAFGKLGELLTPGSRAWEVLARIASAEWGEHVLPVLIALVVALAASLLFRRDAERIRSGLFLVLAWAGITAIVVLTYALGTSRDGLDGWLATSFVRVITTGILLAYFAIMVVVVTVPAWESKRTTEEALA